MVRRLLGMAAVVKNVGCGRPTGRTSLELAKGAYKVVQCRVFGNSRAKR